MADVDIIGAFARAATCIVCSAPVGVSKLSGKPLRYCGAPCASKAHRQGLAKRQERLGPQPYQCQACGKSSLGPAGRLYCSAACHNGASASAARVTATCAGCGVTFHRRRSFVARGDTFKYCSRSCGLAGSREARARHPRSSVRFSACIECGAGFRVLGTERLCGDQCREGRKRRLYEALSAIKHPKIHMVCSRCGKDFLGQRRGRGARQFCSLRCGRRQVRNEAGADTHRKRARRAGVPYEPVSRRRVFDRDGWKCQICGVKTPKRIIGTTRPNAPELDHIVPIALGGGHTYDNVQCACRRCNGTKGATRPLGQLNLFPASQKGTAGSRQFRKTLSGTVRPSTFDVTKMGMKSDGRPTA